MSDFNATYPGYAATARLDKLRATEYSYLDEGGHVYLDYTGAGLAAQSQLLAHAARLRAGCYGNQHSDNPTSSASTRLVEQARETVLRFFNATAADYAVIFTPNATGACRLVAESYPWGRRTRFVLTADNHNSVHGIREYAQAHGAQVAYAGLSGTELRTSAPDVAAALDWVCGFGYTRDVLSRLDPADAARALERLRDMLAARISGNGVWFGSRAWIVTARRR